MNLRHGQTVSLVFGGERGGVLDNVVVRVDKNFLPAVHIDTDECNAVFFSGGDVEVL